MELGHPSDPVLVSMHPLPLLSVKSKQKKISTADSYRGVAEEAEYDHDKGRGEDGAEHDAGQPGVDQCYDHILCRDQHRACPAVQRAPQLQGGVSGFAAPQGVWRRHHDP